jgi:hypothetical protein
MDALVAQHSRPLFEREAPADALPDEELPELSLKFALPPIAQVITILSTNSNSCELILCSPQLGFAR